MDNDRFDRLARVVASTATRRGLIRSLIGLIPGGQATGSALLNQTGALAQAAAQPRSCARQTYDTDDSNFRGDAIEAHPDFFDDLDTIDDCAENHSVSIEITDSYRTPGATVAGAIVDPADASNHHAGHAIDMNVWYTDAAGKEKLCNSKCLKKSSKPKPVSDFIQCVKDAGLRWGGDFKTTDPVHIDDGLNVEDADTYREHSDAMRNSVECSACDPCDTETGVCVSNCPEGQQCNTATGVCDEPDTPCSTTPVPGSAGTCR